MTENELIEMMARAARLRVICFDDWDSRSEITRDCYRSDIRAALSALPIPLSDLLAVVNGESVIVPVGRGGMDRILDDQFTRDRFPKIEARPRHD